MAKVIAFRAEVGFSAEIKGRWYKFHAGIEVQPEEGEDFQDVKKKAWNTVNDEVERQVFEIIDKQS